MYSLPVDQVIPELLKSLSTSRGVVLQAPPGSGKTSRVPIAILNAPFLNGKRIIMLEPRRLAAVNAATWLAKSLGEEVGERVGYSIRYHRKVSNKTRIEVVTEGVFVKRLQNDPLMEGVGAVIFDEFHERSLAADTALALCIDVQNSLRCDLKIAVMSATLDSEPVARLIGDAPVITAMGKVFDVAVRYLGDISADISKTVGITVVRALGETSGDILVFLPGSGEIRRCFELLQKEPKCEDLLIVPLYGDLPFEEQERAILPAICRKVVLATNIAETSLTIEGVGVVIDSGLSRRMRFDPSTGVDRLITERISAASATQRSGRAGRLGPGVCYRLWNESAQATLLPFNPPEIKVADLATLALELADWGVSDPATLAWLDPPAAGAMNEARTLLRMLGALDESGRITVKGRKMAELPLHPRLARLVLAGEESGMTGPACDLAVIIEERDIFRRDVTCARPKSDSDYVDRLEALNAWRNGGRSQYSVILDTQACRSVERASKHLRQVIGVTGNYSEMDAESTGKLLMHAFPDRIAFQREGSSDRYLLANGTGARLGQRSALNNAPIIVAVEVTGAAGAEGTIHSASTISVEMLRTEFKEAIVCKRQVGWDEAQGAVFCREEERFGELVLKTRSATITDNESARIMLDLICREKDLRLLPWTPAARQLQERMFLLRRLFTEKELPELSNEALAYNAERYLSIYLKGARSLSDLKRIDTLMLLKGLCSWDQEKFLEEAAPTHLAVPSGSSIMLDYTSGTPVLHVKLQELFGLAETPVIANGKATVLLHLLSPARRPIQVTNDLRSFWNTTYPEVKKELKGRYPKHPWPDDPWTADPTRGTKKRGNR